MPFYFGKSIAYQIFKITLWARKVNANFMSFSDFFSPHNFDLGCVDNTYLLTNYRGTERFQTLVGYKFQNDETREIF